MPNDDKAVDRGKGSSSSFLDKIVKHVTTKGMAGDSIAKLKAAKKRREREAGLE